MVSRAGYCVWMVNAGNAVVLGLGTVVVDHLLMLPAQPAADTKVEVLEDHLQVGGPVPTALVQLRRLGHYCRFIGGWGDDRFGELIEADFDREGIDRRYSPPRADRRTGFAHVWVNEATGLRTIAYQRASNPPAPGELPESALDGVVAVHLDGYPGPLALELARRARARGCTVCVDVGSPKPGLSRLLGVCDVVNSPRRSLLALTGSDDPEIAAGELLTRGPRLVMITDGDRGAWAADAAGVDHLPAFDVGRAVDTTGAGDSFCGGLIHGVLAGWPRGQMLAFAMAAAAIKCRGLGNRDALATPEAIHDLLGEAAAAGPPGAAAKLLPDACPR